jgi:sulfide dehydrogenase cytochrome subunit
MKKAIGRACALMLCLMASAMVAPALAADSIVALANTCNNCHGLKGVSVGASMPSIGGQSESYLRTVMLEWKNGTRYSATMGRLLKGYSDEQIVALAKYFAAQPWVPAEQRAPDQVVFNGRLVSDRCTTCHGERGGQPSDDQTPRLNGQWALYLEMELNKYRDEEVKLPHRKMRKNAQKLEPAEVYEVSNFMAVQKGQ